MTSPPPSEGKGSLQAETGSQMDEKAADEPDADDPKPSGDEHGDVPQAASGQEPALPPNTTQQGIEATQTEPNVEPMIDWTAAGAVPPARGPTQAGSSRSSDTGNIFAPNVDTSAATTAAQTTAAQTTAGISGTSNQVTVSEGSASAPMLPGTGSDHPTHASTTTTGTTSESSADTSLQIQQLLGAAGIPSATAATSHPLLSQQLLVQMGLAPLPPAVAGGDPTQNVLSHLIQQQNQLLQQLSMQSQFLMLQHHNQQLGQQHTGPFPGGIATGNLLLPGLPLGAVPPHFLAAGGGLGIMPLPAVGPLGANLGVASIPTSSGTSATGASGGMGTLTPPAATEGAQLKRGDDDEDDDDDAVAFDDGAEAEDAEPAKPRKSLSAYNFFFKDERVKLLKELEEDADQQEGNTEAGTKPSRRRKKRRPKISFEDMARTIGKRWKEIDPERLEEYKKRAKADKERYEKEQEVYLEKKRSGLTAARAKLEATVSESTREEYLASQGKKRRGSSSRNPKPSKK